MLTLYLEMVLDKLVELSYLWVRLFHHLYCIEEKDRKERERKKTSHHFSCPKRRHLIKTKTL